MGINYPNNYQNNYILYYPYEEDYYESRKEITKKAIYEQVVEYYNFHEQLKKYFNEGINFDANKKKEKFFFVNSEWIRLWKHYVNYENAIKYIDRYENFVENIEFNSDIEDFNYIINSGDSLYFFLSKTLLEIKDFDCLINEKTYNLFSEIFPIERFNYFWSNVDYIEGIFYERMLILFIYNQKRIKVFYQGEMEGNFELIQLNIDFYFPESNYMDESYNKFISYNCDCEEKLLKLIRI
jgi:hypothetical protein